MDDIAIESFPMKAGEGPLSYNQNSSHQREGINISKSIINEAVAEILDIKKFSTSKPFTIVDFGCSTGPNTFVVVQNVVDAVELKYQQHCPTLGSHEPEFQVYFNDHVANDFNTLLKSIPHDKRYFAAATPGSFYARLFPKASLHFVHSSYALPWLSTVPKELVDKKSAAWNNGRITYANAPNEVFKSYSAQFRKDVTLFLNARGEEVVEGGLMALLLLATPDEITPTQSTVIRLFDLLGSCLVDMAKSGILAESEIDSFNLPVYCTSHKEMKDLIETNGCFSIEKMETLFRIENDAESSSAHLRAATEGVLREHFGGEIMDELFNRYATKVAESSIHSEGNAAPNELFIVLKRKDRR